MPSGNVETNGSLRNHGSHVDVDAFCSNSGNKKPANRRVSGCFVDVVGRPETRCWCPKEDSNLHDRSRYHLKVVRLPIPPSGQGLASASTTARPRVARLKSVTGDQPPLLPGFAPASGFALVSAFGTGAIGCGSGIAGTALTGAPPVGTPLSGAMLFGTPGMAEGIAGVGTAGVGIAGSATAGAAGVVAEGRTIAPPFGCGIVGVRDAAGA
jgi:hypothetical protein